ncbi:MAG TPA: Lrp/AsnC family transcriptional regulator [Sporichthyaceae bacterium]|nr:Lrp/AsnC family transcriptional regulator [Sporichthyaceae bacterium]
MDPLDAQIVAALRVDARTSYADIGEVVGLSAPAVKRRVDRLRATGAIKGFTAVVDPAALGWTTEAFVELYCVDRTTPATIRAAVSRYPEVVAASTVTGEPDAMLHVLASDIGHLERVVEQIGAERFVARTRSFVVMSALLRRHPAGSVEPT